MSIDIEARARIAVLERCLGNIAQIATLTLNAGAIPPAADASPAVAPATSQGGKGGGLSLNGLRVQQEPSQTGNSAAPAIPPTVPPERTEAPQQDKDGTWYFTCAGCGKRKRWAPKGKGAGLPPWPGAKCWDCYKAGKP